MVQAQMILPYHVYLREESMQPITRCQRQGRGAGSRAFMPRLEPWPGCRHAARCTLHTARGHYTVCT